MKAINRLNEVGWARFETLVPGKWVLSGEHAVLRGLTAIALPHLQVKLRLSFEPKAHLREWVKELGSKDHKALWVEPFEARGVIHELLIKMSKYCENLSYPFEMPEGLLKIHSTIPTGAGLGSSAALCVGLVRWAVCSGWIPVEKSIELATYLEHHFHGRSSGMDVAVAFSERPILFRIPQCGLNHEAMANPQAEIQGLEIRKLPQFTFHDTGMRARTHHCVQHVHELWEKSPELAKNIDRSMGEATNIAVEGLKTYDQGDVSEGLRLIALAMRKAQDCFYSWNLVPRGIRQVEEDLLKQGALATKLTGAGAGGILVGLWGHSKMDKRG